METTKISPEQTVGEIQATLCKYGAKAIQLEYEAGGVKAVKFIVEISGNGVPFVLPCRWEAVHTTLVNRMRRLPRQSRKEEYVLQAKRVAWRQILRWVQAQLALVETDMVRIEEVFMPYLLNKKGQTLYEAIAVNGFKGALLEGPKT